MEKGFIDPPGLCNRCAIRPTKNDIVQTIVGIVLFLFFDEGVTPSLTENG